MDTVTATVVATVSICIGLVLGAALGNVHRESLRRPFGVELVSQHSRHRMVIEGLKFRTHREAEEWIRRQPLSSTTGYAVVNLP
jgi:hypothetical protein